MMLVNSNQTSTNRDFFTSPEISTQSNSTTTTTTAYQTISTLNASKSKSLTERNITLNTLTPTPLSSILTSTLASSPTSSSSSTSISAQKKKKKKKTKAPNSLVQTSVSEQLGNSFALAKPNVTSSSDIAKISILNFLPDLTPKEHALLRSLIINYRALENLNLFEVFLADFFYERKTMEDTILPTIESLSSNVKTKLEKFHDEQNILLETFRLYIYHYDELEYNVEKIFDSHYYRIGPEFITWLDSFSRYVADAKDELSESYQKKIKAYEKSSKIREIYQKKYEPIFSHLDRLIEKVDLFKKCLNSKNLFEVFVEKLVFNWQESAGEMSAQIEIDQTLNFTLFVQNFLVLAFKNGLIGSVEPSYVEFLESIPLLRDSHFNKKSIAKFLSSYKDCSHKHLIKLVNFTQSLNKANNDATYTYKMYCSERKITHYKDLSREKFLASLLHSALSTHLIDGWLNHIHNALHKHCLSKFEGTNFNAVETYSERLNKTLKHVIKKTLPVNDSFSAIVERICSPIEKLIDDAEEKLKKIIRAEDVPLQEISMDLDRALSNPTFRLSECQAYVKTLYFITKDYELSNLRIDEILNLLLEEIKEAKDDLVDIDPADLKAEIKKYLIQKCTTLAAYVMIVIDTQLLFSKSHPQGAIKLLPPFLVRLFSVKGFDEIFLATNPPLIHEAEIEGLVDDLEEDEASDVETKREFDPSLFERQQNKREINDQKKPSSACSRLITQDEALAPKDVNLKSKKPLPEKEEFSHADNLRILDTLLTRMECEHDHTTGDHHIYRHKKTRRIVVVPLHPKRGTLISIRNQAYNAQPDSKQD